MLNITGSQGFHYRGKAIQTWDGEGKQDACGVVLQLEESVWIQEEISLIKEPGLLGEMDDSRAEARKEWGEPRALFLK